jgi:small subunit ribosomal protein S7
MRKKQAKQIHLAPDPKFNDQRVSKFINCMMHEGKKNLACTIFYGAIDDISASGESGIEVWRKALENVTPTVEVKRRKVGGATYQIPEVVRDKRKQSLSMKWIIDSARKRNEKTMRERLAKELLSASKEEGNAFKKKIDMHKTAESHKAYSHIKVK